jgi:hypothetical protein
VSAHYIESQETGTETIIETIKVHNAPVEEIKVKYAEEIQVQETDIKYKKVGHLMNIFTDEEKVYI